MKFCWHIYELDDRDWKQEVLEENERGRWIRTYHPQTCVKCGKQKYWHFGKDWVWKGNSSFVETTDIYTKMIKDFESLNKELDQQLKEKEKILENMKRV
jgi:hypothetical protein